MYKIPAILVAITLVSSFGLSNVYASNWDRPSWYDLPTFGENKSYPLDWNKHKEVKQNQKGWATSKVCGLQLCADLTAELAKSSTGNVYLKGYP